jgi:class 3 adenylate cyclase
MKRIVVRRVRGAPTGAMAPRLRQADARLADGVVIRQFDPTMLELGDLSAPCQEKEAIAAVFDLTGFTMFCNQVDAYLAIPRFLSDFLDWIFTNMKMRITERDASGSHALWAELPMMVKFLGDGLLILWNARRMAEDQVCRIAISLFDITRAYRRDFYPRISTIVNKPPDILRCGVARGKVFSVGGGKDYVGHCVNHASRLSHLGLSFCFPHRGFQVREFMPPKYLPVFVPKSVSIRGVGDNELVWVVREEFERMPPETKALFRNPVNVRV